MPHVARKKVLFRDLRFHAAFPSVIRHPQGGFVVAFRRARDPRFLLPLTGKTDREAMFDHVDHLDARSHIAMARFDDDLNSIGAPWMVPAHDEAADQDPSLLRLRDGRLIMAGFRWYPVPAWIRGNLAAAGYGIVGSPEHHGVGFMFWGGWTRHSDDDGVTWGPSIDLPVVPGMPELAPGFHPYHGGAVRGRMVEAPDGAILLPAYIISTRTGKGVAIMHRSDDRGESWRHVGVIAEDLGGAVGFVEPALYLAQNGALFAFHRTVGLEGRLAVSRSDDLGATWGPWRALAAVGHPCDPLTLPDGRALLLYGRRHAPFGVRAKFFDIETGQVTGRELVIRRDSPSPDVGYPWGLARDDGSVLVVNYQPDDLGTRMIVASVLTPPASRPCAPVPPSP